MAASLSIRGQFRLDATPRRRRPRGVWTRVPHGGRAFKVKTNEKVTALTRRHFLLLVGIGGTGAIVAACGGSATPSPSPVAASSSAAASAPAAPSVSAAPSSAAAASSPSSASASGSAAASPAASSPAASSATAASGSPGAAASAQNTSVTVALAVLLASIDPATNSGQSASVFYQMSFDPLVYPDATGKMAPRLATAWKNIDPLTWEFTLRNDVKFADGQPFDAATVKFNVERIIGPGGQTTLIGGQYFSGVSGAEVVSPTVVRVKTKNPDPILPNRFSNLFMVSPDYPPKPGDGPYGSKTNGTGPFQTVSYSRGESYVAAYNPNSWRAKQKDISLRTIKIVAIPDAQTVTAALKNREIDIAFPAPINQLATIQQAGIVVKMSEAASVFEMPINIQHEPAGSPFLKKEVRQAINYAIDKKALAAAAYGGLGQPLNGQLVTPQVFGYNPDLKPYEFDLAKAKQLLAGAGVPDGFPVKMGYTVLGDTFAEPIQGMLKAAGLSLQLEKMDLAVFVPKSVNGTQNTLTFSSNQFYPMFDADATLSFYSNLKPAPTRTWINAQFDQLTVQARQELDTEKRRSLLQQAFAIMREEAPTVFEFPQSWVYGLDPRLSGFTPRSDALLWFDDITKGK